MPTMTPEDDFWEDNPVPLPVRLDKAAGPDTTTIALVTCGGDAVAILDRLDANGTELLCYNYTMKAVQHLRRPDLVPRDKVETVLAAIARIKR